MKYLFIIISILLLAIAPFFGQIEISLSKINDIASIDYKLFWDLRVPRVVVAFFTTGLAGCGFFVVLGTAVGFAALTDFSLTCAAVTL